MLDESHEGHTGMSETKIWPGVTYGGKTCTKNERKLNIVKFVKRSDSQVSARLFPWQWTERP